MLDDKDDDDGDDNDHRNHHKHSHAVSGDPTNNRLHTPIPNNTRTTAQRLPPRAHPSTPPEQSTARWHGTEQQRVPETTPPVTSSKNSTHPRQTPPAHLFLPPYLYPPPSPPPPFQEQHPSTADPASVSMPSSLSPPASVPRDRTHSQKTPPMHPCLPPFLLPPPPRALLLRRCSVPPYTNSGHPHNRLRQHIPPHFRSARRMRTAAAHPSHPSFFLPSFLPPSLLQPRAQLPAASASAKHYETHQYLLTSTKKTSVHTIPQHQLRRLIINTVFVRVCIYYTYMFVCVLPSCILSGHFQHAGKVSIPGARKRPRSIAHIPVQRACPVFAPRDGVSPPSARGAQSICKSTSIIVTKQAAITYPP